MASNSTTSGPPYPDVFVDGFNTLRLDNNQKKTLLTTKWELAHLYMFPARYHAGRFRKLQSHWFVENSWLIYSPTSDGVYCYPCYLFAAKDNTKKVLTNSPLTDWSNITKSIGNHNKSQMHISSLEAAENFLEVMDGTKKDIMSSISSSYNAIVEKNRQILVSIVDTLILCGKQNIALRGHEDSVSNFQALLQYQAKHNPVLRDHLANADPCTKSPDVQNEIIGICGTKSSQTIVAACNIAPYFGFIADEATDAATIAQMSLCLRFYDDETKLLREDFLAFAECLSTTGEALSNAFLLHLREAGIDVQRMRGQGYDGAANMSGTYRGVQARIRNVIPGAIYTHCKAHSLNLAIIRASKETYARNMMDIVQTVAFAFNYSGKRLLCFQENLAHDAESRESMDHRTKLQSLCETRWAARADSLHTFLSAYPTVVTALDQLATELRDTKAATHRLSILTFEFIITLVAIEHILAAIVPLSKLLQRKSCDLIEAAVETRVVISQLQSERNDSDVWKALYEKAENVSDNVGIEPALPRNHRGRQRNRPNAEADTPFSFWRVNMYLPILDHLIVDLETRLLQGNDRYQAQRLIPSQVDKLTSETARSIHAAFLDDIDADEDVFVREADRWRHRWVDIIPDSAPGTLVEAVTAANPDLYPNIRSCLAILLTMPVSSATAERSFSTMRRVKTYLRSTMTTKRLSGLGLLNIYREMDINPEEVVDIFARRKERRLAFIFKV